MDLNALLDVTSPLAPYITLSRGLSINDNGTILATGSDSRTGQSHSYLLRPWSH
jgi:hypothetical protein